MSLPSVILLNRWFVGDTVLLEPIADTLADSGFPEVFVASNYPELFEAHPRVRGIGLDLVGAPSDAVTIDMTAAIRPLKRLKDGKQLIYANKVERMYEAAGISPAAARSPRIYLKPEEVDAAIRLRMCYTDRCIGVVPDTRHSIKRWPYMGQLIKRLVKSGYDVFSISDKERRTFKGVHHVTGLPLRQVMVWLSIMDVVAGSDTGPMHIASALGVQSVVITRPIWQDLYEHYSNCEMVLSKRYRARSLYTVPVKRVMAAIERGIEAIGEAQPEEVVPKPQLSIPNIKVSKSRDSIAIFRLDGLGGTMTMADQAKKIHEATGRKCTIIARGYEDLFAGNPHVERVVNVGVRKWGECLEEVLKDYDTLAEIRFGIGKWHQQNGHIFDQDFGPVQELFDAFPIEYRKLEIHKLHHIQLTDKYLGLPYNLIESYIYSYADPSTDLPAEYIVINDGVDVWHQGARQTKMWDGWNELVGLVDIPFVQVGTRYDRTVNGAIDLRGKTSVSQLCSVARDAKAVVCCEGGLMHIAYAAKSPKVLVLRGPTRGKLFEYPGHRFVDSYICDICWSSTPDWFTNCPKGIDVACMKSITPRRVAHNLTEMLNAT